jgi:hypothetical protein
MVSGRAQFGPRTEGAAAPWAGPGRAGRAAGESMTKVRDWSVRFTSHDVSERLVAKHDERSTAPGAGGPAGGRAAAVGLGLGAAIAVLKEQLEPHWHRGTGRRSFLTPLPRRRPSPGAVVRRRPGPESTTVGGARPAGGDHRDPVRS